MPPSEQQMLDALQESGYLLELLVKRQLETRGYFAEANSPYPDPATGISRELDVSGLRAFRIAGNDFIFAILIVECENNHSPFLFFESRSPIAFLFHEQVKISGVPTTLSRAGRTQRLSEALSLQRFHHYCSGRLATQYCSFTRRKDNTWMAFHPDEAHHTIGGLINALEATMDEHYGSWPLPRAGEEETLNLQFYYPLLVLQGPIYLARGQLGRMRLAGVPHVQLRREIWSSTRRDAYQIDVVRRSYLPRYLRRSRDRDDRDTAAPATPKGAGEGVPQDAGCAGKTS